MQLQISKCRPRIADMSCQYCRHQYSANTEKIIVWKHQISFALIQFKSIKANFEKTRNFPIEQVLTVEKFIFFVKFGF